jgi:hypothetical protein
MIKARKLVIESLEQRLALASSIVEYNNIGYVFDSNTNVVGRYDIPNEAWLQPITLQNMSAGPTVAHVDANGIYAGFDRSIFRYRIDGTGRTHLINLETPAIAIHSDGNLLFLNHSISLYAKFVSIDKNSNSVIDTFQDYGDALSGSSIAPSLNKIFGRSIDISPSDVTFITYNDRGRFGPTAGDSPYHGDYFPAIRTWVFPDGSKVIDDSGIIYATSDLTYASRLSRVNDIGFVGGQLPIVLYGKDIIAYSRSLLPTGSVRLDFDASRILVGDDSVIVFTSDTTANYGYRIQSILLSAIDPPDPVAPIDPTGLEYTPDWSAVSAQGRLLILSKSNQNLFRWNPTSQAYDPSIGLLGRPTHAAYSSLSDMIYVAYPSGLIYQIDLKAADPREFPFAMLPGSPIGLSIADDFVFAADDSGAWNTHHVISPQGAFLDSRDWNYFSYEYVWSSTNRRMYFFRDFISPNDLIYESIDASGRIQQPVDSPYHQDGWIHPIRVSPDGRVVVLGSGLIYNALSLQKEIHALANTISDATWFAGGLITLRSIAGVPQLQQWLGPTYELSAVKQWERGRALSIHRITNERLLVVTIPESGVPAFSILGTDLEPASVNITWHNPVFPLDVDDDNIVSPLDVLRVVNQINQYGWRQSEGIGEYFCDVNNDGSISALDVLLVINWLNSRSGGEGESTEDRVSSIDGCFASDQDWLSDLTKRTRRGPSAVEERRVVAV